MVLSKSKRKRELATVVRMGFEMAGILISLGLQGVIIGSSDSGCEYLNNQTVIALTTLSNDMVSTTDILSTDTSANKERGFFDKQRYFLAALIVVSILILVILLLFCGTKENLGIKVNIII